MIYHSVFHFIYVYFTPLLYFQIHMHFSSSFGIQFLLLPPLKHLLTVFWILAINYCVLTSLGKLVGLTLAHFWSLECSLFHLSADTHGPTWLCVCEARRSRLLWRSLRLVEAAVSQSARGGFAGRALPASIVTGLRIRLVLNTGKMEENDKGESLAAFRHFHPADFHSRVVRLSARCRLGLLSRGC